MAEQYGDNVRTADSHLRRTPTYLRCTPTYGGFPLKADSHVLTAYSRFADSHLRRTPTYLRCTPTYGVFPLAVVRGDRGAAQGRAGEARRAARKGVSQPKPNTRTVVSEYSYPCYEILVPLSPKIRALATKYSYRCFLVAREDGRRMRCSRIFVPLFPNICILMRAFVCFQRAADEAEAAARAAAEAAHFRHHCVLRAPAVGTPSTPCVRAGNSRTSAGAR